MKLIPDWRKAHKFLTVQMSALLVVLSAMQADALPLLQPLVNPVWWPRITAAIGLTIIVLRLIQQTSLEEAPPKDKP